MSRRGGGVGATSSGRRGERGGGGEDKGESVSAGWSCAEWKADRTGTEGCAQAWNGRGERSVSAWRELEVGFALLVSARVSSRSSSFTRPEQNRRRRGFPLLLRFRRPRIFIARKEEGKERKRGKGEKSVERRNGSAALRDDEADRRSVRRWRSSSRSRPRHGTPSPFVAPIPIQSRRVEGGARSMERAGTGEKCPRRVQTKFSRGRREAPLNEDGASLPRRWSALNRSPSILRTRYRCAVSPASTCWEWTGWRRATPRIRTRCSPLGTNIPPFSTTSCSPWRYAGGQRGTSRRTSWSGSTIRETYASGRRRSAWLIICWRIGTCVGTEESSSSVAVWAVWPGCSPPSTATRRKSRSPMGTWPVWTTCDESYLGTACPISSSAAWYSGPKRPGRSGQQDRSGRSYTPIPTLFESRWIILLARYAFRTGDDACVRFELLNVLARITRMRTFLHPVRSKDKFQLICRHDCPPR